MPGLRDAVQGLAARDGVEAVLVISTDGLPIDQAIHDGFDPDAIAALTASLLQSARRLGTAANCATFHTGVLDFGERMAVFASLGPENMLFVLVRAGVNIGPLLYDVRRHSPALAALL